MLSTVLAEGLCVRFAGWSGVVGEGETLVVSTVTSIAASSFVNIWKWRYHVQMQQPLVMDLFTYVLVKQKKSALNDATAANGFESLAKM